MLKIGRERHDHLGGLRASPRDILAGHLSAESGVVRVVEGTQNSAFEEGRGPIRCVVGALECERPLLVPCYKFLARHPCGSVHPVPSVCLDDLAVLGGAHERSRHFDGAQELQPEQQAPRVDAQASDGWTGAGGLLIPGSNGDGFQFGSPRQRFTNVTMPQLGSSPPRERLRFHFP